MTKEQFQNAVWGMYGNNTISRAWELYRQSQHALWMARARLARRTYLYSDLLNKGTDFDYLRERANKWRWVERKCREKAKEFE